jgi:hypothetical protein
MRFEFLDRRFDLRIAVRAALTFGDKAKRMPPPSAIDLLR